MEKHPLTRTTEAITSEPSAEQRGFSLRSPEGTKAMANLARLATRSVTLEQLNDPRYGIEPDGSLRLDIDAETFEYLTSR